MSYIPITEAIKRLGKSDRQVRRMVHAGKLGYKYAPDRKLLISSADIDKVSRRPLSAPDVERLDRLEHEIEAMRQELDTLSKRIDDVLRPQQKAASRSLQPQKRPSESDTLPPEYTSIQALIKEHGLTAQRKSIISHMEAAGLLKRGTWKMQGHPVSLALDEVGQAEFMRRYVNQS